MEREKYVTIKQLSVILGVPKKKVFLLLRHGYLKRKFTTRAKVSLTPQDWLVELPPPAAIDWLKEMFRPIYLKSVLPLDAAIQGLGTTHKEALALLVGANISPRLDSAFGELLTLVEYAKLIHLLHGKIAPLRTDRGALIQFLLRSCDTQRARRSKLPAKGMHERTFQRVRPRSYSERVEMEVKHILKMEDPDRTLRAVEFIRAFADAKELASYFATYSKIALEGTEITKVEKALARLEKELKISGVRPVGDNNPIEGIGVD